MEWLRSMGPTGRTKKRQKESGTNLLLREYCVDRQYLFTDSFEKKCCEYTKALMSTIRSGVQNWPGKDPNLAQQAPLKNAYILNF